MINENTPLMDYVKDLERQNEMMIKRLLALESKKVKKHYDAYFISSNPIRKFTCFAEASRWAVAITKDEPILVYGAKKVGQTVIKAITALEHEKGNGRKAKLERAVEIAARERFAELS